MRIIGNRGNTARKVQAVASGALASGDTVIVNSDGTVSVIAGAAEGPGSPVVFNSASSNYVSTTFDSNSNKVVVCYANGPTGYGMAAVGTVSGTSISFGTPVAFLSAYIAKFMSATFDSSNNKIVIAYQDGSNGEYGTAIVGTVSGTSISFGTPVVFNTRSTMEIATAFDSNSNKVIISYNDAGGAGGQYGNVVVGTVSGTSISFGSKVVYNSSHTYKNFLVFDSNSNKVVFLYVRTQSADARACVGTVSGTSISFGSNVTFASGYINFVSAAFDSSNNKILTAFNYNSSGGGRVIVGTVSGTSISFGAESTLSGYGYYPVITYNSTSNSFVVYSVDLSANGLVYETGTVSGTSTTLSGLTAVANITSAQVWPFASAYDSSNDKIVLSFLNGSNSSYGTTLVFQNGSTNLTAENYIGIASNGYATGQAATVNVKGFIDDNQSSLTAGQSYYVQVDGTLNTTAGDPSVFAGTAVSATKLIVKG